MRTLCRAPLPVVQSVIRSRDSGVLDMTDLYSHNRLFIHGIYLLFTCVVECDLASCKECETGRGFWGLYFIESQRSLKLYRVFNLAVPNLATALHHVYSV